MRTVRLARATALAGLLALPSVLIPAAHPSDAAVAQQAGDLGHALRSILKDAAPADRELRDAYRAAGYRPLWINGGRPRPEALALIHRLSRADSHGLKPANYRPDRLLAWLHALPPDARPSDQARVELMLSRAFATYVAELRSPPEEAAMAFTATELAPAPTAPSKILAQALGAPDLGAHLAAIEVVNPVYDQLRSALVAHRRHGGGGRHEALILANMDRVRQLPRDLGRRYVLVNVPSARLWYVEDGRVADQMPVGVGRRSDPTPALTGLIRFAVYNPHWNLPQSMVREEIAPGVLRVGLSYLTSRNMEALSDWSPAARVLDPADIDWRAVSEGARPLRVRQKPGPNNTMGRVKLMLPNVLGIYLHDTPDKSIFGRQGRAVSAGCIRLQDAPRLAESLLGGRRAPGFEADARVDLPQPVPVYITYLTLEPQGGRLVRRPDIYGLDATSVVDREQIA